MMGGVTPETCSDFAVNKYLQTVAPGWTFINIFLLFVRFTYSRYVSYDPARLQNWG